MKHTSYPAVAGLRTPWGPFYFDGLIDDIRIYEGSYVLEKEGVK